MCGIGQSFESSTGVRMIKGPNEVSIVVDLVNKEAQLLADHKN